MNCPDCHSDKVSLIGPIISSSFFGGKFIKVNFPSTFLYECGHCGLKFKYPILDNLSIDELYRSVDTITWSNSSRNDFKLVRDELLKVCIDGKKILDIGCNRGDLLADMPSSALRFGVEPNLKQHNHCASNGFLYVWPSLDDVIKSGEVFDFIVMTDVLEHINQPSKFIELAVSILKPDGVLIITTGDADSLPWKLFRQNNWYPFYQEHISFVNRRWINFLCSKNHLTLLKVENFIYQKHSFTSYAKHLIMALVMGISPRFYKLIFRIMGYGEKEVFPFGFGLVNDHFIVQLKKRN